MSLGGDLEALIKNLAVRDNLCDWASRGLRFCAMESNNMIRGGE